MPLPRIVVTATDSTPVRMDIFRAVVKDKAFVVEVPLPFSDDRVALEPHWAEIELADAIFARTGYLPQELLARCTRLKGIVFHGSGIDQADGEAAKQFGIPLIGLPGLNANGVAEFAVGLMLAALRHIPLADRRLRTAGWDSARFLGRELLGKKVGIVGFGQIGRRVMSLLAPFNVQMLVNDPAVPYGPYPGLSSLSLEELLSACDIVTLHLPLNVGTRHLLNGDRLALMKEEAVLINTSRGGIIDKAALLAALAAGRPASACLDVFDPEPPLADDPLLRMDNVILTPHLGGSTAECLAELARQGALRALELLQT